MGRHSAPAEGRPEPVAIAAAAQAVLAVIVTFGWVQIDSATIASLATGAAAIVSVILTMQARSQVTPVSDPILPNPPEIKAEKIDADVITAGNISEN